MLEFDTGFLLNDDCIIILGVKTVLMVIWIITFSHSRHGSSLLAKLCGRIAVCYFKVPMEDTAHQIHVDRARDSLAIEEEVVRLQSAVIVADLRRLN